TCPAGRAPAVAGPAAEAPIRKRADSSPEAMRPRRLRMPGVPSPKSRGGCSRRRFGTHFQPEKVLRYGPLSNTPPVPLSHVAGAVTVALHFHVSLRHTTVDVHRRSGGRR